MDRRILLFKFIYLLLFFFCRRFFYFSGRPGDYMKLRESPAENGRVGISVYTSSCNRASFSLIYKTKTKQTNKQIKFLKLF